MRSVFLLKVLILSMGFYYVSSQCTMFNKKLAIATLKYRNTRRNDLLLENSGFVLTPDDIEFGRSRQSVCNESNFLKQDTGKAADILTGTAELMNPVFLESFVNRTSCHLKPVTLPTVRPKYRPIDGYGNNLKNPYWGMANMPFGRFGPKNYKDSVHSIQTAKSGKPLPSPRQLVMKVLTKAQIFPRTANEPNEMLNYFVLMITHDVAFQVPAEASNNCNEIRCCAKGNLEVLQKSKQNSACIPIQIPPRDPFYNSTGVRCFNTVRSELSSPPDRIQYGEIRNKVTAAMDLSIIYGSSMEELAKIRTYKNGTLNLGAKNLLPTEKNGKYSSVSNRLTSVIQSGIFPALMSRNHNNLANGLKEVNPGWNDEKCFQEARRINIAVMQNFVFGGTVIESVFKKKVNETYKEDFNPATFIEFSTSAYRFLHYFLQPYSRLQTAEGKVTEIPLSDTFQRIDILENRFDDIVRGELNNKLNMGGNYSDEIINKFVKNKKGAGLDVISIDILRGRDHGVPSYLTTRRLCGFQANFTTFDDLLAILPKNHVDLLKSVYETVEDIELYIGGILESFVTLNDVFVGSTFGCIIGENYRRMQGGDAYYFTHPTNPYPFTSDQLAEIKNFSFNRLICTNTGLTAIQKLWSLVENQTYNTKLPCSVFPKMNLTAWTE